MKKYSNVIKFPFVCARILPNNSYSLYDSVDFIINNNLVAFATETVYGIGANSYSNVAIQKLYNIKQRPMNNPLIVHFADVESIKAECITNEVFDILAKNFMPGALTVILEKKLTSKISRLASNSSKLQAVRIPNHPSALQLIKLSGVPIAAASANMYNKLSPTTAMHVQDSFGSAYFGKGSAILDDLLILDGGQTTLGLESTVLNIVDQNNIRLLRNGSLSIEEIEKIGIKIHHDDTTIKVKNTDINLQSPGRLSKHYSPNTKLRLNVTDLKDKEALIVFGKLNFSVPKNTLIFNLSETADLVEAAHNLYSTLWQIDELKIQKTAVTSIPNVGLGVAINERLIKASNK